MEIDDYPAEQTLTLHDDFEFISKQDVAAGSADSAAYTIEGPRGYVIGVDQGTQFAPEFRTASGEKLDGSTKVTVQKCDKLGHPLSGGIVFSDTLNRFDYEKFRNDPDFQRKIKRSLMIAEREIVKIFLSIPEGADGFSAEHSRVQLGDDTSDFGTPVEIIDVDNLTPEENAAVKAASQANGGN